MCSTYISPEVKSVIKLHQPILKIHSYSVSVCKQLTLFAEKLYAEHQKNKESDCIEITNRHPAFIGKKK